MNVNDYIRLNSLSQKLNNNQATKDEKDEYMQLMYSYGKITSQQYQEYLRNKDDSNELVNGALAIGGIFLLGYLLSKLFEK